MATTDRHLPASEAHAPGQDGGEPLVGPAREDRSLEFLACRIAHDLRALSEMASHHERVWGRTEAQVAERGFPWIVEVSSNGIGGSFLPFQHEMSLAFRNRESAIAYCMLRLIREGCIELPPLDASCGELKFTSSRLNLSVSEFPAPSAVEAI